MLLSALSALSLSVRACAAASAASTASTSSATGPASRPFDGYVLDYTSTTDPALQAKLEQIDVALRAKYAMTPAQAAVGLLDLNTLRLAMIHPDRIE